MIQAGIVGGSGYTGVELVRLLAQHPAVGLSCITSRAEVGMRVAAVFPNLRGHVDLCFVSPELAALAACDMVFFATPNGTAMTMVPGLLGAGVRVIDLSADFRLTDPTLWREWYGVEHAAPELLGEAVYGLPEWYRAAIRQARLVANPGCYPTAVTLGLAPLLAEGLVHEDSLIADAKSGLSGAGRKAAVATLLAEASDNVQAYGVPGHRHHPEIVQHLRAIAASASAHLDLTFVPHLTPMVRGIHATLYAELRQPDADLQAVFARCYAGEPFVDVMPPGSHPETRSVRGVNQCRIAVHRPRGGRRVVVLSVIDNLVKGAAGQAIQNMNIMLGLDETAGLTGIGLVP